MDKPKNLRDILKVDVTSPRRGGDRSNHMAWKGGDVVVKKADPRRKNWGWGANSVQFHDKPLNEEGQLPFPLHQYDKDKITHEPSSPDHEDSHEDLKYQKAHRDTFTDDEKKAHKDYKLDSEMNFNDYLRSGHNENTGRIKVKTGDWDAHPDFVTKHVPALDRVTSLPTKEPMTLYRGFGDGFPIAHLKPGQEFTDHGYTGLSKHKGFVNQYGQVSMQMPGFARTVAKVHVPVGTKGHLLDHPDVKSPLDHEGEFTLQRGTRFQVSHHTHHTDPVSGQKTHFVHLNVVGQHAAEVHEAE